MQVHGGWERCQKWKKNEELLDTRSGSFSVNAEVDELSVEEAKVVVLGV